MVKQVKKFDVTLNQKVVEKSKRFLDMYGGTFSGLISFLLNDWNRKQEGEEFERELEK